MHGLGNDFVVIDATSRPFELTSAQIQAMSNRRFGVGFYQLLVLEPPKRSGVDFHFRIFNADGSEVAQCGNGARCIAQFIRQKGFSQARTFRISTLSDVLELTVEADDKVSVLMGIPRFNPPDIPFIADTVANT